MVADPSFRNAAGLKNRDLQLYSVESIAKKYNSNVQQENIFKKNMIIVTVIMRLNRYLYNRELRCCSVNICIE